MFGRKDGVTPDALTSIFSAAKANQEGSADSAIEVTSDAAAPVADEDLSAELDALDIDGMNFDDDDDDDDNVPAQEENIKSSVNETDESMAQVSDWRDRPELYSRHFRPSKPEAAVLESVAEELRVRANLNQTVAATNANNESSNGLFGLFGGGNNVESTVTKSTKQQPSAQTQWDRLVSGKNTTQTKDFPISILLRRGTVMYNDTDDSDNTNEVECELLLFTRGFLLATKNQGGGGFLGIGSKPGLTPVGSALWTSVHRIQTTPSHTLVVTCGGTVSNNDDSEERNNNNGISFEISPLLDELPQWTKDLQDATIKAHQNLMTSQQAEGQPLGWQYRLCQTPWFTEAVTNQADEGYEMRSDDTDYSEGLNKLDKHHGLAPLHYAVRLNNTDSIRVLLEAGANPNVPDAEGKTPMYYVQRDELPASTRKILEQFGAVKSDKIEEEKRGELFGKVVQTEDYRETKKQAEAVIQAAKAEAVQNQMAQNMQLMHKRGEQIEELGDKANDLNQGAEEFSDMAKQLKDKMKKKSMWGF